ncbi:alpha/beta-hydrolase [Didymella exigua CBS 183.55]|uniref:Alpha/beta-hydrolase n=1 Tax=Didymella exigua CBS 183.55 TaxID=1150837 RepID=A0A6A5RCH2_9PLEO|nr:alpha/beta-hydrolase [Didymella exigua CBS 183.55]KAF1925941.1 alpha/beta-hydrolase [Didymella exigua CBS 183.55]
MERLALLAAALVAASLSGARATYFVERQVPANATGVTAITSPQGAQTRLNEKTNMFFCFFEARENPQEKPLSLWLNGGPGSNSLIGLFQEHGPCVGFSYDTTEVDEKSRYSLVDPDAANTIHAAAVGAWHILQIFLELSPQLDADIKNPTFNLWTESHGGHCGPGFDNYFYRQNEAIRNGSTKGVELHMDTLGVINGLIDEQIQAPYYPEFAINNTYGIKAYNDTVYTFAKQAFYYPWDCNDQIEYYKQPNRSTEDGQLACSSAMTMSIAYYFVDFLNLASTQEALGFNINYTSASSSPVFSCFSSTGDFVYSFIEDLSDILGYGVRVALLYSGVHYICNWYICNWFGGEAVSLIINHTDKAAFNAAGYTPFLVDGVEYGQVREYGNFSFTRIYEASYEVPYYRSVAILKYFKRVLDHVIIADGSKVVIDDYSTNGTAKATHTEPYVPLPPTSTPISYINTGERRVKTVWRD